MEKIAEKTGWGNYEYWTHPQFVKLSNLIFEECNVLISVSSLKRFFGKIKSTHEPHREIRNALARFIGYADWDDFVYKNQVTFPEQMKETGVKRKTFFLKDLKVKKSRIVFVVSISLFIFGLFAYLVLREKTEDFSTVQFSGKYLTGLSPHTVVFSYDVSKIRDSVFIDYDDSFSERNREYLNPNNNTITHLYLLPDFYHVRLICNNKTIRIMRAHFLTDGWVAYMGYDNKRKFFPISFNNSDGMLQIDPDTIFATGLVRKDDDILIKYRLVQNFEVNGDRFSLKATVKDAKKVNTLHCFFAAFVIHGNFGKIKVSFTPEECINKAWIIFDDVQLEGRNYDLSAIAADFSRWQRLEIMVRDNRLIIKINDKECFNHPITGLIGTVRALLFDTTPSGVLKDLSFTNL